MGHRKPTRLKRKPPLCPSIHLKMQIFDEGEWRTVGAYNGSFKEGPMTAWFVRLFHKYRPVQADMRIVEVVPALELN